MAEVAKMLGVLLTPKEAAARLRISVSFLARLAREGRIASVVVGFGGARTERRFTENAIEEFIQRNSNPMRMA